jgi:hypothetical protein
VLAWACLNGGSLEFVAGLLQGRIIALHPAFEISETLQGHALLDGRLFNGQRAIALHRFVDGDILLYISWRNLVLIGLG